MNKFNETVNKVQEIEKRLDNINLQGELNVFEFKKGLDNANISSVYEAHYLVGAYRVQTTVNSVVLQGEVSFANKSDSVSVVEFSVRVDNYVIFKQEVTINAQEIKSVQAFKAVPVGTIQDKYIEVVVKSKSGGEISILGWDFFLWGYGITVISGGYESKSLLNAVDVLEDGTHMVYLVLDQKGYYYYGKKNYDNFSIDNFVQFGNAKIMDGAFLMVEDELLSAEEGEDAIVLVPLLYNFVVDPQKRLRCYAGEDLGTIVSEVYVEGVTALSVARLNAKNEIVVLYAKNNELYYFEVKTSGVSQSSLLYSFNENITEISVVKDCKSTQFVIVSLSSGKNYMFNSVTEYEDVTRENVLKMSIKSLNIVG